MGRKKQFKAASKPRDPVKALERSLQRLVDRFTPRQVTDADIREFERVILAAGRTYIENPVEFAEKLQRILDACELSVCLPSGNLTFVNTYPRFGHPQLCLSFHLVSGSHYPLENVTVCRVKMEHYPEPIKPPEAT